MHTVTKAKHFFILDAARGIAAACVFLYHLKPLIFTDIPKELSLILSKSYLAVDLFFIMSGLVITKAYYPKMKSKIMTFNHFLIKRLFRLYPLYISGLLIGFGHELSKRIWHIEPEYYTFNVFKALIINGLFLPDYYNDAHIFALDPAAWSLSLEWIFNLIFAGLIYTYTGKPLLTIIAFFATALLFFSLSHSTLDLGWGTQNYLGGFARIAFSFTLGAYIYHFLQNKTFKTSTLTAYLMLIMVSLVMINPLGFSSVYYDLIAVFLIFPLFVIVGCSTPTITKIPSILKISGDASYALYILHTSLILWVVRSWTLVMKSHPSAVPWVSFPVFIIVIFFFAYVSTRYFDTPVRRYLNKKVKMP